jgi:hypothetical protein
LERNFNLLIVFSFSGFNEENCYHFDEVSRLYPIEFEKIFQKYARKKTRQSVNAS